MILKKYKFATARKFDGANRDFLKKMEGCLYWDVRSDNGLWVEILDNKRTTRILFYSFDVIFNKYGERFESNDIIFIYTYKFKSKVWNWNKLWTFILYLWPLFSDARIFDFADERNMYFSNIPLELRNERICL